MVEQWFPCDTTYTYNYSNLTCLYVALCMFQVHRESKDGIVGAAGGISVDRTVWNIIRSHLSKEVANDGNAESEARTGEEGDGVQQIIYVTYQDPDDPSEARTLHIVDDMQADSDAVVSGLYSI